MQKIWSFEKSFEKSFENFLNKTITKIFKGLLKGLLKGPKFCTRIGTLISTGWYISLDGWVDFEYDVPLSEQMEHPVLWNLDASRKKRGMVRKRFTTSLDWSWQNALHDSFERKWYFADSLKSTLHNQKTTKNPASGPDDSSVKHKSKSWCHWKGCIRLLHF